MFESIMNFFKALGKKQQEDKSKDAAKERLHLVLMQDRANVSADFLDMMKQEIIEVIKKYIDVDESEMDVRLTNKTNTDGTTGAPALYANIPIVSIKEETRKMANKDAIKTSVAIEKNEEETSKDNKKANDKEIKIEKNKKEENVEDKTTNKEDKNVKEEQNKISEEKKIVKKDPKKVEANTKKTSTKSKSAKGKKTTTTKK